MMLLSQARGVWSSPVGRVSWKMGGRRARSSAPPASSAPAKEEKILGTPYTSLTIGVPKETWTNELRVACTPAAALNLTKKGFTVQVESGAGMKARFRDKDYESVGAKIIPKDQAFQSGTLIHSSIPRIMDCL